MVIAAVPGGFKETTVCRGQAGYVVNLHRDGDTLVGSLRQTNGTVRTLVLTYLRVLSETPLISIVRKSSPTVLKRSRPLAAAPTPVP